jgi:hypothetical protein
MDSYRRTHNDVCRCCDEKAEGIETGDGKGIRKQLDEMLDDLNIERI